MPMKETSRPKAILKTRVPIVEFGTMFPQSNTGLKHVTSVKTYFRITEYGQKLSTSKETVLILGRYSEENDIHMLHYITYDTVQHLTLKHVAE